MDYVDWEVQERAGAEQWEVAVRTDDNRHYVILVMEDEEDAETIRSALSSHIMEIRVSRA